MWERFRRGEISAHRLGAAISRRVADLPHTLAWQTGTQARENRKRLEAFRNVHAKERCFVVANGPSLRKMNLSKLQNEITIGMNRIYLNFEKMGFATTYYVAVNDLVIEQFAEEIKELSIPKFLNWNYRGFFAKAQPDPAYLRTRLNLRDDFQRDMTRSISSGGTVTYVALQLAHYMGFKQVVLIGLDHRFAAQGTPNVAVQREGADRDHFVANYFPVGSRWQLPDLRRSEIAYTLARQAYEKGGRQIVDATVDGACKVFDKMDYEALFS